MGFKSGRMMVFHVSVFPEVMFMSILSAPNLSELSVVERLDLIEVLWNSLLSEMDAIPLAAWQRQEIDRCLQEHEQQSGAGESWSVVKAEILAES